MRALKTRPHLLAIAPPAADRGREPWIELAVDAHGVREVDDVVDALHLPDLDRGDVAGED